MTCKDCIHYEICRIFSDQYGISKVYPSDCGFAKDKSRFVELPCQIGSEVYVIENCTCGSFYAEVCESNLRTQAKKYIKAVKLPAKRTVRCAKLFVRPFKAEYLFKIGKTVFLTREEAEKKLEEMQK